MGNKKNIDRLFQEKFKDFEVFPERDLWSGIEAKMDNASSGAGAVPEKGGKIAPAFWWRMGGIAAAIALLLSLGLNFLVTDPADTSDDPIEKIVQGDKTDGEEEPDTEDSNSLVSTDNSEETEKQEKDITPPSATENYSEGTDATPGKDSSTDTREEIVKTQESRSPGTDSTSQQESDSGNTGTNNTDQQATKTQLAGTDPPSAENKEEDKDSKENKITESRIADATDKEQNNIENATSEKNIAETTTDRKIPDTSADLGKKEEKLKKSLLEAIAEMENETDREKEVALKGKDTKKWSINPNVAPVYYNSLGGGSPIDPEFEENSKSGKVNLSYGINIAYQVSNRVSLRSGINRVNYGYNTNDISFAPNFEARALSNIDYSPQSDKASGLYVSNANEGPPVIAREEVASSLAPLEGLMQQEFGYIEVPMEVKYRVVDNKLGLNLIGGVSSLFLTDNSVLLKSESLATELGEANNVNDMNFSTNVGLGVDYLLSDKLQIQVEPMFKYQWNTFSNDDGGFKPYSFGVYTGFSFRF